MLRSGHLFSFPSFHCSVVGVQVSLGSKILSARGSALPALQSLGLGVTVPSPLMSGSVGWVLNLLRCHWKCSSASARSYISTHQPCCCPLCCSSPQGTQHLLAFLHSSSELWVWLKVLVPLLILVSRKEKTILKGVDFPILYLLYLPGLLWPIKN